MNLPSFEIKPHQLSPLLITPRSHALFFVGFTAYIGYIDPNVRKALQSVRLQLRHWAQMFKPSIKYLGILSILGTVTGVTAYIKTKVNLWLVGVALMLSLWPYTLAFLMPINNYLLKVDAQTDLKKQLSLEQKLIVEQKMNSWVKIHRGRTIIAGIAAAIFYLAQLKSTGNVITGVVSK